MRVEVGAGEKPHPDYDVHVDVLPLPDIEVVCRLDHLPFPDGSVTALRANHVLEHQSYELVATTVGEWARVLRPGGALSVGVPDARLLAGQWAKGELTTREANYWILGGHSDRDAHKGVDERGVPRWFWNAHHTLFDEELLREVLATNGFRVTDVVAYAERNLRAEAVRHSPVA
ncbi:MAG: methyltransferase domain-containing protein [Actinomycetota bacterium]|nr:methyltransferase domain-containing protein [Actinomycetota bacterium]